MTSRYSSNTMRGLGRGALVAAAIAGAVGGCDPKSAERRPMPTAAQPGPCSAKPRPNDPANVQYLPPTIGAYCLDPTGSDRAYGEDSKTPINGICDVIDGDCEIYKQHDVRRVVEARYVDGGGSSSTIDVYLSKFASRDKAYAMFTKRVVGDGDPAISDAPRPISGGGAAALGIGNAYLWRGAFLAEVTLNDDTASTKLLRKRADELLPKLMDQLGGKLPGSKEPPPAVAALPAEGRLPLGVRYVTADVLGIKGAGPGALGYYQADKRRWRLLSIACGDADQAEDVLASLKTAPGADEQEGVGEGAVRLMRRTGPAAPQTEWLVARQGKAVLGIGDERLVLREGMTADEHRARTLSQEDKRKRLQALLEGRKAKADKQKKQ